jgi:hypothetical protein
MRGLLVSVLLLAGAAPAQTGGGSLEGILSRMADTLARTPNYTCTQTVERRRQGDPCPECELMDRFRLEIALIGRRERFAWPGDAGFQDKDLDELIPPGLSASGDFAGFAAGVFLNDHPVYEFAGPAKVAGKPAWKYDYRVPLLTSGFSVRSGEQSAKVPYQGSFWVDRKTLDVLRLEMASDEVPPEFDIRKVRAVVEYGRVRIGGSDFLLPRSTETEVVRLNGGHNRNKTEYSGCRQYTGESTIRFEESEEAAAVSASSSGGREPDPAGPAADVPAGVSFIARLDTAIDFYRSAAGDPLSAVLVDRLARDRKTLVPKGAVLRGRIGQLERLQRGRVTSTMLLLRFTHFEFEGRQVEFHGRLFDVSGWSGRLQPQIKLGMSEDGAWISLLGAHRGLPPGLQLHMESVEEK